MAGVVSKTYGHALFELAVEKDSIDQLLEEAEVVTKVLADNPDLVKLYNHPKIDLEEKKAFTETCFGGRVSADMTGFLLLIIQNGRQNDIPVILQDYVSEVKEYRHIGIAYVTSALPLTEAQKAKICERLVATTAYETFEMHYQTDGALIGGIVIQIGDRVMDSSIRTQIAQMQKELQQIQI